MEVKQYIKAELQKIRGTIENIQQQFNIKQTQGEFLVAPLINKDPSPPTDNEPPKDEDTTTQFEKFKTLIKKQLNKRKK